MSEITNQLKSIDTVSNQNDRIKKYNELIEKIVKAK